MPDEQTPHLSPDEIIKIWSEEFGMRPDVLPVEDLLGMIPNAKNPHLHKHKDLAALGGSIETAGFKNLILLWRNPETKKAEIVYGEGRIRAGSSKYSRLPVAWALDLDKMKAKFLRIADNRAKDLSSEYDDNIIISDLSELKYADFDLGYLRMEKWDLQITNTDLSNSTSVYDDNLAGQNQHDYGQLQGEPGISVENTPNPEDQSINVSGELRKKWETTQGQLWEISSKSSPKRCHRLLCGDSTSESDVSRLLDGAKPFIMVTDPPYGVNYDPNWRNIAAEEGHLSYGARAIGQVMNDDKADWSAAWELFPGDVVYTWSPPGDHVLITGQALINSGFNIRSMIIWRKSHFAISRGDYHYQHEPCWYAVRKGSKSRWCGDRTQSTIWDITHIKNETGHGTQKPLECMARPIRNHGGKDDDVYDPFLGSGTTMVASERAGRICYGMELDPAYVAVILERLSNIGLEIKRIQG
jgi:hypothetical protein